MMCGRIKCCPIGTSSSSRAHGAKVARESQGRLLGRPVLNPLTNDQDAWCMYLWPRMPDVLGFDQGVKTAILKVIKIVNKSLT